MPELAIPNLGPFLLVQGAVAFVVIGGAILAWLRGSKRAPAPNPAESQEQRWFFDGPVARALEYLKDILNTLQETRHDNDKAARDLRDRHDEHMEAIRELLERLPRRR